MPLNICDSFFFAVLQISKGLVFLPKAKCNVNAMQIIEENRYKVKKGNQDKR